MYLDMELARVAYWDVLIVICSFARGSEQEWDAVNLSAWMNQIPRMDS